MNIKTTLITLATVMTITCNAGGLYIVSGGDFRLPILDYMVETTKNNQTIIVSPKRLQTIEGSTPITDWSLKIGKEEITAINGEYTQYTFPAAGLHRVRLLTNNKVKGNNVLFGFSPSSADGAKFKNIKVNGNVTLNGIGLGVTNVVLNNVSTIGSSQFSLCTSLKSISFTGSTPTKILDQAFTFSKLTEFTVPSTVESIGFSSFAYVSTLKSITFENKNIVLNPEIFHSTPGKNFTAMFRKTNLTDVYFKGTASDWSANTSLVHMLGAIGDKIDDSTYKLQTSQHALDCETEISNTTQITPDNANDPFITKSKNGLIKLHLIGD